MGSDGGGSGFRCECFERKVRLVTKKESSADSTQEVGRFFDAMADEYDAKIARCVPRYEEMLTTLLAYLPDDFAPRAIVDLGCGTGGLSRRVGARYPDADLTLVDLSADSLDVCRRRFTDRERVDYQCQAMQAIEFSPGSIDLVVSSIAIHHLRSPEKLRLFEQIYRGLRPGGQFAFADQFAGVTQRLYTQHIDGWRDQVFASSVEQSQWDEWMEHQTQHDHHESLAAHFKMLEQVGFTAIDCPWRHLLWTIVVAEKPG